MLEHRAIPQALLLTKVISSVRRVCLLAFGPFGMQTLILPLHQ